MAAGVRIAFLFLLLCVVPQITFACDLCAIYSARRAAEAPTGSIQAGFFERYTSFEATARSFIQQDELFATQQYMQSSIAQFYMSYHAFEKLSFQLTLPYIYRRYKRVRSGFIEKGEEYGIGDLSLLAQYYPLLYKKADTIFTLQVFTGIKLATGDSDRLRESTVPPAPANPVHHLRHGAPNGTLVAGDDLTIGSGSTDGLIGSTFYAGSDRYFFSGNILYALRTEGTDNFEFGDEISWIAGPGVYFFTDHEDTLSLQLRFSGDAKQNDKHNEREITGSSHDRVYLGPELAYTSGGRWQGSFGVDIPIKRESTNQGLEPEYRINIQTSYWF